MLAFSHALTGAVIAKVAPTPTIGYLLALLSHPILDLVPHWDLQTRHIKRPKLTIILFSSLDAISGFLVGVLLFSSAVPVPQLLLTMFIAQFPDWLEAPLLIFDWNFSPFSWVKSFQHALHSRMNFPDGLLVQAIFIFFLLLAERSLM